MSPEFLTQEKKEQLETELKHLKTVVRPTISERLQAARALGDLSENAEYQTSRDEQGKNETRIQQLEHILKHAKIIKRSGGSKVELGATVTIKKLSDGSEKVFMIVDEAEADIAQNKISPKSLIGAALCGKNVGEKFVLETPRGNVEYEILSVS